MMKNEFIRIGYVHKSTTVPSFQMTPLNTNRTLPANNFQAFSQSNLHNGSARAAGDHRRLIPGRTKNRVLPTLESSITPDELNVNSELSEAQVANVKKPNPLNLATIAGIVALVCGLAALTMSTYAVVSNALKTATTSTATAVTLRWNTTADTIAGNGTAGSTRTQFNSPSFLAFDSFNTLYVADMNNSRVQQWVVNGWFGNTVAGQSNGNSGFNSASLFKAGGIVIDTSGGVYVTDVYNCRIQYWANGASSGTTVAGNGTCGTSNNILNYPYNLFRDSNSGTLYVADSLNHRVVSYAPGASTGTLVAGGNGAGTNTSQLNFPIGLYFNSSANALIIGNAGNNNIVRWVIGESNWTLVAGSAAGATGNSSTMLYYPVGLTFDSWNNMYVADAYNHRIQFFSSGSSIGTTIAGVANMAGSNGSLLKFPYSVILDSSLNLYVADGGNNRIQKFSRY